MLSISADCTARPSTGSTCEARSSTVDNRRQVLPSSMMTWVLSRSAMSCCLLSVSLPLSEDSELLDWASGVSASLSRLPSASVSSTAGYGFEPGNFKGWPVISAAGNERFQLCIKDVSVSGRKSVDAVAIFSVFAIKSQFINVFVTKFVDLR